MIVTPKKIPVRHNGQLYGAGQGFEIERKDYERIQTHLEVIDDEDKPVKPTDPELQKLRERGKELGVANVHKLGIEKLTAAINEKEAELVTRLKELREKAVSLGIEDADEMSAEALTAAIAAKGGSGDGN